MAKEKKSPPITWAFDSIREDKIERFMKDALPYHKFWHEKDSHGDSLLEVLISASALKCTKWALLKGLNISPELYETPPLSMPLTTVDFYKEHQKLFGLLTALINAGANVNAVDVSGQSALHVAACGPIGRSLRPLWEGTRKREVLPNPNAKDYMGNTPMHLIFLSPHDADEVVQWLNWGHQFGADFQIKNKMGQTPLSLWLTENQGWSTQLRGRVGVELAKLGAPIGSESFYKEVSTAHKNALQPSLEVLTQIQKECMLFGLAEKGMLLSKKKKNTL